MNPSKGILSWNPYSITLWNRRMLRELERAILLVLVASRVVDSHGFRTVVTLASEQHLDLRSALGFSLQAMR